MTLLPEKKPCISRSDINRGIVTAMTNKACYTPDSSAPPSPRSSESRTFLTQAANAVKKVYISAYFRICINVHLNADARLLLLNKSTKPSKFIYENNLAGGTRRRLQPANVIKTRSKTGTNAKTIILSIGSASNATRNPLLASDSRLLPKAPTRPFVLLTPRSAQVPTMPPNYIIVVVNYIIKSNNENNRTAKEPLQLPNLSPTAPTPKIPLTPIALRASNPGIHRTVNPIEKMTIVTLSNATSIVPIHRPCPVQFVFT